MKIILFFIIFAGFCISVSFSQDAALVINEIMSANITSIHDEYDPDMQNCPVADCEWWYEQMGQSTNDGDYPDWIEIFNPGTEQVNLTGYALSDDPLNPYKWTFPNTVLAAGEYLLVFASGKDRKEPGEIDIYMHTNFKIDRKGETILLSDNSGTICDQVDTGEIPLDFSLGRYPDGGSEWVIFYQPTPDNSNSTLPFPGFTDSVQTSYPAGFYSGSISLSLSANSTTAEIHYTLDGNDPTLNSNLYTNPISITQTTVVKARSYENGILSSKILIRTYFINETFTLPVISLSTIPEYFWDADIGIYIPGNNADEDNRIANYWQDWERPVYVEFFEPDGSPGFRLAAGTKIFGWGSRRNALKSLSIMIRDKYGQKELNYQLFADLTVHEFRSFVLRTAGNDWQGTFFRDPFALSLIKDKNFDIQAFRPAILFINGVYWGIHNIREKLNEDYLASHHNIDRNNVDIISRYWRRTYPVVIEGDDQAYLALENYLDSNSPSDPEHYEHLKTVINIDNYLDYCVFQIYCANYDWPGNNNKCWRSRTAAGKWRWLTYDLDYTFHLNDFNPYTHNTLAHATDPNGAEWPNPPFTTFLLRKMFENEDFRNGFINRFADYLNTIFVEDIVLDKIDHMKEMFAPEMQRHIDKWGSYECTLQSMDDWENNIDIVREFISNRKVYVCDHICDKFNLAGLGEVELNISQTERGKIKINSIIIDNYPWQGEYFKGIPIQLTALPKPGYRFTHWTGISSRDTLSSSMKVNITGALSLTACFEEAGTSLANIIINEINYRSSEEFDPEDWVELYNPHSDPIDISGWQFKDTDDIHQFIIPDNTIIPPDNYMVLCRDVFKFCKAFPGINNYRGDFNFDLNRNGELICLFNTENLIIDSLTYGNDAPWPVAPDGNGPTLSLRSVYLDNSVAQHWGSSSGYGTPGAANELCISNILKVTLDIPSDYSLNQNYPNPFNPDTYIRYRLPERARVQLEIFSLTGQKIRTLVNMKQSAGSYTIVWDGRDELGKKVASGIYFYRIKAVSSEQTFITSKKMILLK
jgi:hypothetical protein